MLQEKSHNKYYGVNEYVAILLKDTCRRATSSTNKFLLTSF